MGGMRVCVVQAIAHADNLFSEEGNGWKVPSLHPAAAVRIERWAKEGTSLVRWAGFVTAVQQQVRTAVVELAYHLFEIWSDWPTGLEEKACSDWLRFSIRLALIGLGSALGLL